MSEVSERLYALRLSLAASQMATRRLFVALDEAIPETPFYSRLTAPVTVEVMKAVEDMTASPSRLSWRFQAATLRAQALLELTDDRRMSRCIHPSSDGFVEIDEPVFKLASRFSAGGRFVELRSGCVL